MRSETELQAWATESGCETLAGLAGIVDFQTQVLVVLGFPDRPDSSVTYVTQTLDGVVHVGVEANAYCGGARPPGGFVMLTIDTAAETPLSISSDACYTSCNFDGGLPPP